MTIDEAIKERQKLIEVQEKLYEEASTNCDTFLTTKILEMEWRSRSPKADRRNK